MAGIMHRSLAPFSVVWAVLVASSLSSWRIGGQSELGSLPADLLVVIFIALKIHLIGGYFMELRHAPRLLTLTFNLWIAAVSIMILALL